MKVAIVDYGMGNLHSVLKSVQAAQALSNQNAEIYLTSRPEEVMAADKVIFPGQGAMPDCMSALKASGLGEAVSDGLKIRSLPRRGADFLTINIYHTKEPQTCNSSSEPTARPAAPISAH